MLKSAFRITHCSALISILPANLLSKDRLAAIILCFAPILTCLVETGTAWLHASHSDIHARLRIDLSSARIVFIDAVVLALVRWSYTVIWIAILGALTAISKASLRRENLDANIVLINANILAFTSIRICALLSALTTPLPTLRRR